VYIAGSVDLNPISPLCPALPALLPKCLAKDPNECDNSRPCQERDQVCCPTQCLGTKCIVPTSGEGEGEEGEKGGESGDGLHKTSDTELETGQATASAVVTMIMGLVLSLIGLATSLSLTGLGALHPAVALVNLPISVIAGMFPTVMSLATTVLPVIMKLAESVMGAAGKK